MPIEVKSFASQADEAKDMPNARMEAVNVLGQRVMKLTLAPDWKWSKDIRFRTHNQNMTVAARAMADRNTLGHRSYRVATRRQSLSLPNILSMRLRRL